jgi:hypothetical protein
MTTLHEASRTLYEITGDIKDINTLLIPRSALAQHGEPVGCIDYGCEPHYINWEINPHLLPDGTSLYAGAAPAPQAQQVSWQPIIQTQIVNDISPMTNEQIKVGRTEGYDAEDTPDAWDFEQGVRFAERHHGIGEKQ